MILLPVFANSQEQSAKRIQGSRYYSVFGTYNGTGKGMGLAIEKYINNNIYFGGSLQTEFGKFDYSSYSSYIATIGAGYSYLLGKNIYLEGRVKGFIGLEKEKDELEQYHGIYSGFILTPEIEYYINQKTSFSFLYNQYINITSKLSSTSNAIGIKLNRKF